MDDPDDTFARTLVGIEKLRGRGHEDDWLEWRRTVAAAVRSGEKNERRLALLEKAQDRYARATAVGALADRLKELERERDDRKDIKGKILAAIGKIGLVLLGAIVARILKQ